LRAVRIRWEKGSVERHPVKQLELSGLLCQSGAGATRVTKASIVASMDETSPTTIFIGVLPPFRAVRRFSTVSFLWGGSGSLVGAEFTRRIDGEYLAKGSRGGGVYCF
jgi:hypothetical protein